MKHFLSIAFVFLSLCVHSQDTLIRSFNATATFSGFSVTNTGRYAGTLNVNDQSGTYYADSVKVNDYVFASNGTLYVVDTVGSASLFSVPVTIRRISGQNVSPIGVGDVFRPTKNYGLYTFTPDNQNGISSQAQFIKLTGAINRIDSIAKDISTKTGGVIAPNTQSAGQIAYFTGNDTLSGSNNLFWDASNNRLGIGTTTPGQAIEIKRNISTIRMNSSLVGNGNITFGKNDTIRWNLGTVNTLNDFGLYNSQDSIFTLMAKTGTNRVGIRTDAPTEALHVKGKVRADTLNSTLNFLVTADSSGVLGRVTPTVLLDSLYRTISYTYWSTTGADLTATNTDSIIARAKVHAWTLRAESGAISNVLANFNFPLDSDLGKTIVITGEDESSSYGVQLSGVLLYGVLETAYNMIDDQSITLSAQKTSSGNRWVIVSNSIDVIDPSTYATRAYVNNLLSRDTITSGSLTSGSVTVNYSLFGTGTPTLTSPTAGSFTFTMPANTDFRSIVVTGNSNNLNGSLEFIFAVNNTANSSDQHFNVQMYDIATNALVDQHATSTNHTQTVSSNTTTMVFPGMGLFSVTGFRIILR
jgi:hypothetical protein